MQTISNIFDPAETKYNRTLYSNPFGEKKDENQISKF